jgi:hypothetical protein
MRIRAMQWAAVNASLKLVRSPFDAAITMLPDLGTRVRPAVQAAIDAADTGVRAIVATVLGDPVAVDDAHTARQHRDRDERHDGRGRQSKSSGVGHHKEPHERAREQRVRTRHKSVPERHQAAAAEGPIAVAEPTPVPLAPPAARASRTRGAITGTAERTDRAAGRGSRRRAAPVVNREDQAPPASAGGVSPEPSHEEIAACAYELYQRGVPGDANSHWEAAKRELSSAPR